jgi:hypothetical protein
MVGRHFARLHLGDHVDQLSIEGFKTDLAAKQTQVSEVGSSWYRSFITPHVAGQLAAVDLLESTGRNISSSLAWHASSAWTSFRQFLDGGARSENVN